MSNETTNDPVRQQLHVKLNEEEIGALTRFCNGATALLGIPEFAQDVFEKLAAASLAVARAEGEFDKVPEHIRDNVDFTVSPEGEVDAFSINKDAIHEAVRNRAANDVVESRAN